MILMIWNCISLERYQNNREGLEGVLILSPYDSSYQKFWTAREPVQFRLD